MILVLVEKEEKEEEGKKKKKRTKGLSKQVNRIFFLSPVRRQKRSLAERRQNVRDESMSKHISVCALCIPVLGGAMSGIVTESQ